MLIRQQSATSKMAKSEFVANKTMAKLEVGIQTFLCLIVSNISNIVNKCLNINRFLPITRLPLSAVVGGG